MNGLADRRREEKERRRDEILDAAADVAAETGFDAITMDQVARKARLSRALVYVYFRDKMDMHFALCGRALELLLQRFGEAIAAQPTGRDELKAMGLAYVSFSQQQPVYFEALARFEARETTTYADNPNYTACLDTGDRLHGVMTAAIHRGIADESIRADVGDPDAVAITLWGFMHGTIQVTATKGALLVRRGTSAEALFDQALQLALHALSPKT